MLRAVFGLLIVLLGLLRASVRARGALVLENLLLRRQLAVLTRPTRERPPLRRRDKLVWILARRLRRDGRRHLVVVRPETVVGWHRRGWRLEQHPRAVLTQFVAYYNAARPHQTLALDTPHPATRPQHGPIRASPVLGGLHHVYERAA